MVVNNKVMILLTVEPQAMLVRAIALTRWLVVRMPAGPTPSLSHVRNCGHPVLLKGSLGSHQAAYLPLWTFAQHCVFAYNLLIFVYPEKMDHMEYNGSLQMANPGWFLFGIWPPKTMDLLTQKHVKQHPSGRWLLHPSGSQRRSSPRADKAHRQTSSWLGCSWDLPFLTLFWDQKLVKVSEKGWSLNCGFYIYIYIFNIRLNCSKPWSLMFFICSTRSKIKKKLSVRFAIFFIGTIK